MKVLVTLAVKSEFAPWRRLRRFEQAGDCPVPAHSTRIANAEVTAVLVGVGARNLAALRQLLSEARFDHAVVAGLAGGLIAEHRPGDILAARSVCGEEPGSSRASDDALFRLAVESGAKPVDRFLSLGRIAQTPEEKSRLGRTADAVDMESLAVMNALALHGIPAVAIRAIADPVELSLPCDFEATLDERGEIRMALVLRRLLWTPQRWAGMVAFALESHRAAEKLAHYLDGFMEMLAAQLQFEECSVQAV